MNRWIWIGLIVAGLGVLGFVVPRITYQEEASSVQVGPLEVQVERERTVAIPDLLAGTAVAVGGALVVVGAAKSRSA